MFEVRRGNVLSAEMLFHVPPHRPRNKEEFVSNPGRRLRQRTPAGRGVPACPAVPVSERPTSNDLIVVYFASKTMERPPVKRSLKVRLCAGGKAALELSVAALFQNAERFRGFVYVGPLPVRIEGAGGFMALSKKWPCALLTLF